MAALEVGDRLLARADAIEEVARVVSELVAAVAGGVFQRLRPKLIGRPADGLRAADGMSAHDARDDVHGLFFAVRDDFETVPADSEARLCAVEDEVRCGGGRSAGGAFANLAKDREVRIFKDRVLHVGDFAVILEDSAAADAGDACWSGCAGTPMNDVERMLAQVGHLPAGVIPEPAEMVDGAVGIIGALGRGTEPEVVVEFARRRGIWRIPETWEDVAKELDLDGDELADLTAANEFARAGVVGGRALLGADLDDAVVAASGVEHPAALFDEEREGLFDVNVFARAAGHHGHKGVPVVRRRDNEGVDVFVFEKLPEVVVTGGGASDGFDGGVEAGLKDIGHGDDLGAGKAVEIARVQTPDEAKADDADADAVVGAENSLGGECGCDGGALGDPFNEVSPFHGSVWLVSGSTGEGERHAFCGGRKSAYADFDLL